MIKKASFLLCFLMLSISIFSPTNSIAFDIQPERPSTFQVVDWIAPNITLNLEKFLLTGWIYCTIYDSVSKLSQVNVSINDFDDRLFEYHFAIEGIAGSEVPGTRTGNNYEPPDPNTYNIFEFSFDAHENFTVGHHNTIYVNASNNADTTIFPLSLNTLGLGFTTFSSFGFCDDEDCWDWPLPLSKDNSEKPTENPKLKANVGYTTTPWIHIELKEFECCNNITHTVNDTYSGVDTTLSGFASTPSKYSVQAGSNAGVIGNVTVTGLAYPPVGETDYEFISVFLGLMVTVFCVILKKRRKKITNI